jgi:hypothetical protein
MSNKGIHTLRVNIRGANSDHQHEFRTQTHPHTQKLPMSNERKQATLGPTASYKDSNRVHADRRRRKRKPK